MKNKLKYLAGLSLLATIFFVSCQEDDYSLGDLNTPSNLEIITEIEGQSANFPNGDGTGVVNITLKADNAISYGIKYNLVGENPPTNFTNIASGITTKNFEIPGEKVYRITASAYGTGGLITTAVKDITVRYDFVMDLDIINNITNGTSKTWVVDKDVPSHFRIGPWDDSANPATIWWSAAINEKVNCCNCFYTATYTFTKTPANTFELVVTTPDGVFMNRNSNENYLGVTAGGGEACHPWTQPTKGFTFGNAEAKNLPADISTTTGFKIVVDGNDGFIGYGSACNTYEILESTSTYLYLRARGANQGNFWYIKMKPAP